MWFFKTEKTDPPDLFKILELELDATSSDKGRVSFDPFALLPAPFFEAIQNEDMSPPSVLAQATLFCE